MFLTFALLCIKLCFDFLFYRNKCVIYASILNSTCSRYVGLGPLRSPLVIYLDPHVEVSSIHPICLIVVAVLVNVNRKKKIIAKAYVPCSEESSFSMVM